MSARRALGAGLTALLAGGLVALAAAALYLQQRNRAEQALIETPAAAYARRLARAVTRAEGPLAPADLQRKVAELAPRLEGLELAALVVEPRSTKYRFLRKRRYLAHSQPQRAGRPLDPRRQGDKAIYDLAQAVHRQGPRLEVLSPAGKPPRVRAAVPIELAGRRVMALAITRPGPSTNAAPAWPLALGLGLCLAVGLLGGALLPRWRYALVIGATLMLAAAAHFWLQTVTLDLNQQLAASATRAAGPLGSSELPSRALHLPPASPLAVAALLGLGIALLAWRGLGRRIAAAFKRHRLAYGLLLPTALGMLLLVFLPFGYGLALGFFNHAHGSYTFIGLSNFTEILGGTRPLSHPLNFYFTLGVTVLWTALNVLLHLTIGLALALLLKNPLLRFRGIYRALLILPWAMPNYITALIWKGMFHHQFGAVNHVLGLLGIERVSWFSSFSTAFCANLVTNTWLGFPFMMVVALGALQSIPADVYEAAAVDGASRWQTFWRVTLPLLKPALFPAVILGTIWTFNMFNIIYLVSEGAPGGSTDILITEAYRWAFERADRYGLAAAYALLIFVILLGYTLLTNRFARAVEEQTR